MMGKTLFTELKNGDIFQPPGHPEYRCMKLDMVYLSLDDYRLHWEDDMENFADCGDIFTDNDMIVEVVFERKTWEIVPREKHEDGWAAETTTAEFDKPVIEAFIDCTTGAEKLREIKKIVDDMFDEEEQEGER